MTRSEFYATYTRDFVGPEDICNIIREFDLWEYDDDFEAIKDCDEYNEYVNDYLCNTMDSWCDIRDYLNNLPAPDCDCFYVIDGWDGPYIMDDYMAVEYFDKITELLDFEDLWDEENETSTESNAVNPDNNDNSTELYLPNIFELYLNQ